MPPKKATAAKSGTKAKAVKKKVDKEEPELETKEEVPEKKTRKVVKKDEAPKEEEVQVDNEEEVPQKKAKTAKATTSKKGKTEKKEDTAPNENENGTLKKRAAKPKKAKDEEAEPVSTTVEEKKSSATRGRRAKKTEEPEEEVESQPAEEEASDSKKLRKRKPAAKENKKESKSDEPAAKTTKLNATSTNWETIDFKCSTKNSNGKTPNFHITSWNVDGLRAWLKKGGLEILQHDQPDILCFQETKCSEEKLPDEITNVEGYEMLWCCSDKEGYAGVGIATKIKPLSVTYGIESEDHDNEGRCITAEYEKFFLVNVYVPNAGRKLVTLPKRLEWNKLFKSYIKKLDERKPVIICGDMNVAHTEIDLANPKTNTKNAGFTVEEREGMTDFLEDGYVDTFRRLYPDQEKAYTFWTYLGNARAKNVGWRLDYFIVSEKLMENVCDNIIHGGVLGSDHCPVSLHLNI